MDSFRSFSAQNGSAKRQAMDNSFICKPAVQKTDPGSMLKKEATQATLMQTKEPYPDPGRVLIPKENQKPFSASDYL